MLYNAVFCLFLLLCSLAGCANADAHNTGRACAVAPTESSNAPADVELVVEELAIVEPESPPVAKIGREMAGKTITMTVSGYTSEIGQTDGTPCVGSDNKNMCERKARKILLCAASREFPLHSRLKVPGLGECEVVDYLPKNRVLSVDWYFGQDATPPKGHEKDLKYLPKLRAALKIDPKVPRNVTIVSIPTPK